MMSALVPHSHAQYRCRDARVRDLHQETGLSASTVTNYDELTSDFCHSAIRTKHTSAKGSGRGQDGRQEVEAGEAEFMCIDCA